MKGAQIVWKGVIKAIFWIRGFNLNLKNDALPPPNTPIEEGAGIGKELRGPLW